MILHEWGEVEYLHAREKMQQIHDQAVHDGCNHLICCSHPNIFTLGSDKSGLFDVETVDCDRGGSITCHSPGQNIYYFCFQIQQPALFYKKVLNAFNDFFANHLNTVKYNKNNPGFYIQNRKIASLGFRYAGGVSLHGVALNVDVDLNFHSQVAPCNLKGIIPTSLKNEGVSLLQQTVNQEIITMIKRSFEDAV